MIGTDGVEYNLNRILRVRVVGSTTQTIEYCPLDNEMLNAQIDVQIKYLPGVQDKNGKYGFSAKVKIYNPPLSLLSLISGNIQWPIGLGNGNANQATVEEYYRTRCKVYIDAGYWKGGRRSYTNVFDGGWLNTSAYYRKGTDNILELFCHRVKLSPSDINRITRASEVGRSNYQRDVYNRVNSEWGEGTEETSWVRLADKVILTYENDTPVTEDDEAQMSRVANRTRPRNFYEIHFIEPPKDYDHPDQNSKPDHALEVLAQRTTLPTFTPHGNSFNSNMQELVDSFPTQIVWRAVYGKTITEKNKYYFWEIGNGAGDRAAGGNKAGVVRIINFQNLIEVPSVDGSGCFTVKMLFNPEVWPNKDLILEWQDNFSFGNSISQLTKGVASDSQLGQFYPSLQAGRYQAQVYALRYKKYKNENGYLFGRKFRIAYVTHNLSSRGNAWSTEARTVSAIAEAVGG